MEPFRATTEESLEVLPLVVIAQTFPARPSSIPDIRDFVKRCLAQSPLSDEDSRAVTQTVSQALLDAAGPTGTIQVSFRIFPDHAEVDVLRSHPDRGGPPTGFPIPDGGRPVPEGRHPASAAGAGPSHAPGGAGPSHVPGGAGPSHAPGGAGPSHAPGGAGGAPASPAAAADGARNEAASTSFADWMAGALRREGMTMEVAARQLGVSVKTVSRWVGGATEPRLRDLRRIRELFGDFPFP
jgi:hypothetical protein